jgi:dTDP-4-amino-4,6-dideoxygalactose transaminase
MIGMVDLHTMIAESRQEYNAVWQSLLNKGDFIRGDWIDQLEQQWAQKIGYDMNCVAVGSGTAALEIIMRRIRSLRFRGSVLMPSLTFWATAEAIVNAGLTPILVDVDHDGLIDMHDAYRKRRWDSVAICVVNLYGQVPKTDAIRQFADDNKLLVVEDSAQAHGSERVGKIADYVAWSWYPAKTIGSFGDAGMIGTPHKECAAWMRSMADHGRASHDQHDLWGTNARMSTLQAGILLVQLSHMEGWCEARKRAYGWYCEGLKANPYVAMVRFADDEVPHIMVVKASPDMRDDLVVRLNGRGVGARVHYRYAIHQQPAWGQRYARVELPSAENFVKRCVTLPMHPWLTREDVEYICQAIMECGEELSST